jgi:hypothetical protein
MEQKKNSLFQRNCLGGDKKEFVTLRLNIFLKEAIWVPPCKTLKSLKRKSNDDTKKSPRRNNSI